MAWMDELRGLAIVLVVLFHAQTVDERFVPEMPDAVWTTMALFAPFRMPLLMFLSGMLLARSLSKPTPVFFAGKLRAIAWPYLLWSLVFLAVSAQLTVGNVLAVAYLPPTYLWFLWFLLAYYVAAWLMRLWRIPAWVGLAVGVLGAFGPDAFRFSRFCFLFVFFLAGDLYVRHRDRLALDARRRWLVPAAALVAVAGAVASGLGVEVQYSPLFLAAPLAAVVLAVVVLPTVRLGRVGAALAYVGRDSLVFYVTHFTVLWACAWDLRAAGVTNGWVVYGVTVVVALGVGLALTWARHRSLLVDALFRLPGRPARVPAAVPAGVS